MAASDEYSDEHTFETRTELRLEQVSSGDHISVEYRGTREPTPTTLEGTVTGVEVGDISTTIRFDPDHREPEYHVTLFDSNSNLNYWRRDQGDTTVNDINTNVTCTVTPD